MKVVKKKVAEVESPRSGALGNESQK